MLHKIYQLVGIRAEQNEKWRELVASRGREFQTKIGEAHVWFRILSDSERRGGRERIGIVQTQYEPFEDSVPVF